MPHRRVSAEWNGSSQPKQSSRHGLHSPEDMELAKLLQVMLTDGGLDDQRHNEIFVKTVQLAKRQHHGSDL